MIIALIVAFFCYLIAQIIINSSNKVGNPLKLPTGNILIFDTETNGLPLDWKGRLDDTNNWPRIVSIAWYKISASGFILANKYFTIKPDGFSITNDSTNIHGITNQAAQQSGVALKDVLELFNSDIKDSKYLVAHNLEFDYAVTFCEYLRLKSNPTYFSSLDQICTMRRSTDFCKIPSSKGYKYPKLSELYRKLFSESISGIHNAQIDAEACMKCFKELYNQKIIKF